MDPASSASLLKRTLDPNLRNEAEAELSKIHKIIGFTPVILRVIVSREYELPVRQAGAVYLKNIVSSSWQESGEEENEFSIHEQDRALIRENLVRAIVSVEEVLQKQLTTCLSSILKVDFPGKWPQIVDQIAVHLQEGEGSMMGSLLALYQLVKNYEYKKKEQRTPCLDAMNLLLPLLTNLFTNSPRYLQDPDPIPSNISKLMLKIYFALTQYVLPLQIITKETFTKWMEITRTILDAPIPPSTLEVEEEERPSLIWWKRKKWALHILTRLFERFGSPGKVGKDYVEFSQWYIKTFSHGILSSLFTLLDLYRSGVYVSPRVMQLTLNYLNTAVAHSLTWRIMKPYMLQVIETVIFPIMSYSRRDAELWEADPFEYIRIKFDIFEDFVSPVTAAQTLLYSVCRKRKDMLPKTMTTLLGVLQSSESTPSQKDGALHMIGTMGDILLKKKNYKDQMESFLVNVVFPEFAASEGHLRARACWMLHYLSDVKYNNSDILAEAIRLTIVSLLEDKEVPVKVEAAIALKNILSNHEAKSRPYVEPKIREISLELLKVIRETESDDLASVMQKLVCTYTDQLTPVAVDICRHLVETFAKVLESGENRDERAMIAMGLLNTMQTILSVMEDKNIHDSLEPIVLEAVHHIFKNSIMEFYEEAFSLTCDLTSLKVSPNMWKMLEVIYEVFNRDGYDYFTDIMPTLHNYVTVDTDTFLSNPDFITAIFNMCKKMLETLPGEDPQCHAAKMLEVLILQCNNKGGGIINKYLPAIIQITFTRLATNIRTSELRTMCLQVAIAAMYSNTNLFFETLQGMTLASGSNRSFIEQFIEQWIHDTDCFIGLHDRKICVIGLCQLLTMPTVPGVEAQSSKLIPSLLLLFDGLNRAYEARANKDSSDDDSDDDDDDGEDDCDLLNSDEDDMDDEGAAYLDQIEAKVKSNSSGFDIQCSLEDALDDSDDEYYCYEDTPLESYTTPLDEEDSVDEYIFFKNVVSSLEKKDPAWHHKLFSELTQSNIDSLNEIFLLGTQRLASKESENIKKAGGYNFNQMTVTGQFNFGDSSQFPFGKQQ
ncbi:importin-7 [Lepeophtheirus salmonis]|uniref:Importin 7 [Apis florea] n=1 Tax=Lepeophtheirus salmonis TaxID=72036 RepID=A0A0K2THU0_LEPSM|nr:importin-7-like [Lepeophtheirus salmonis]